ncbi:MAG: M16 family metallopeptidase [Candidatus Binataceae bacterium]
MSGTCVSRFEASQIGSAPRTGPLDWSAARIPTTVAQLDNGLTVVAHCDCKAPVVAVRVVYRAGSRDEAPGKAGLAHICEHLMYSGTMSVPGSYFLPFEQAGAAYMNARVTEDYSAYFATIPAGALDFALWMEADRMANLAAALDFRKFDRQREVVRNELRQRESEPYGRAATTIAALTHSTGHPYSHPPNGILEQLDNITHGDALDWIRSHHGAANAVVVIAGDIQTEAAVEKAYKYFAFVPRGAVSKTAAVSVADDARASGISIRAAGNRRLYISWPAPEFAHADYAVVKATCELLNGKDSQLWQRVCVAERLASDITIELHPRQLGSQVILSATALPGISLNVIKTAILDELERLCETLSIGDVHKTAVKLFATLVRASEGVGRPQGKADTVAIATVLGGHPEIHHRHLSTFAALNRGLLEAALRRYLNSAAASLEIRESSD